MLDQPACQAVRCLRLISVSPYKLDTACTGTQHSFVFGVWAVLCVDVLAGCPLRAEGQISLRLSSVSWLPALKPRQAAPQSQL